MRYFKTASIDVTYKCNLKCRHCYNDSNRFDRRELSGAELNRIGSQIASLGPESFCICGGEPLCRFDEVLDLIHAIKSANSSTAVSMVSNGLLWTPSIAKELRDAGLHTVQFSLDGMSNDSYDFIRQSGGQLSKVFCSIQIAQDAGIAVMLSSVPHKGNYDEFDSLIKFCVDNKICELRVQPLMPLGRGEENYSDLRLDENEYKEIRRKLCQSDNDYPGTLFQWGDPMDHFFMLQEIEYVPFISVNAYGEMLLSAYLPLTIWNLREKTIAEYVEKDIAAKVLELPMVKALLETMCTVDDLSSHLEGLPELFLGQNYDLSELIVGDGNE